MKNSTHKTNAETLDLELKALLEQDLKRFKEAKGKNNRAATGQLLAA